MFINDVGENTSRKSIGDRGANYGWPVREGPPWDPRLRSPLIFTMPSTGPTGFAISGGAFYNPSVMGFPTDFV